MKKGPIIVLAVLLTVLLTLPIFDQTTKAAPPAGNPIKIGGSLPLTGIASEPARWIKAGYEYWAQDVNEKGGLLGRPVKLTIYDDESNADKAVLYYERAITVDKVDFIFGGYPAMSNVALMPMAEKYKKVFVGAGGMMKSFDQGFTYSFGSPPLMSDWLYVGLAGVIDDLIPKADRPKSIAILTMNNVIGLSGRGTLIKAMEERGIKVVVDETYNLPLSDATPLASKAKARGAEILACFSLFDDGVMIMRASKAINYKPKIIIQQVAPQTGEAWMKELGEDGNIVLNHSALCPGLPYPGNQRIFEAATKRLGLQSPPNFFGMGYSWMYTLETAVQAAGTLDNTNIRDYMRSHKFDLPYGKNVTFDARGLPAPYSFATQTTKGKNEVVWPKEVATTKLVYPRPDWSK
ncbi:MAG: amino acid ABC transporter substrate-binding protein [Syntrophorhabdales bacterium]|jgi:branched-chain amino acid transport system substrate-binding protein